MGAITSRLVRPIKNWNIENRAHKLISKEKPTLAPSYDSMAKEIELVNKLEPEYKEKSKYKDEHLNDHLKQVFVQSHGEETKNLGLRTDPNRPLPKEKYLQEEFEFGFYESNKSKTGRVSLRQALQFISDHGKEPDKYSVSSIALEYKLDPKLVSNILEYYRIYKVVNKEDHSERTTYAQPISLRSGITFPAPAGKKKITQKEEQLPNLRQIEEK